MKVKPGIVLAVLLGFGLIASAFYLSPNRNAEIGNVEYIAKDHNPVVRTFIPVKDTDGNTIPDWQEVFASGKINLDELSSTTPYEPKTVTGQVAVSLTKSVMETRAAGRGINSDQLINLTTEDLNQYLYDDEFTKEDINISYDNSTNALKNYGNRIARITEENSIEGDSENELDILNRALKTSNETEIEKLDPIIASYEGLVADMLSTPVPESMIKEHLSLLNVYQAILNDLKAFRNVFNDAVVSIIRYQRYVADALALYTAIENLYQKLSEAGIQWTESDPASDFVTLP